MDRRASFSSHTLVDERMGNGIWAASIRPAPAPDAELSPGDPVTGLADFGKPTGEFGAVEKTNENDALVKWDDDGRMRVHQP